MSLQPNAFRYVPSKKGHYESYFLRCNHPTKPLALWVRYTMFHGKGQDTADGELWGMWFDGNNIVTEYKAIPFGECTFETFDIRVGDATLNDHRMSGAHGAMKWSLDYTSDKPIFLFPESYYEKSLPKAKQLTTAPNSRFNGSVTINGVVHDIKDWPGCQSHNWGPKHTDLYAWGQVSGFDDAPDAYLECASAKIAPWAPVLTPVVLRLDGKDHLLNTPGSLIFSNRGTFTDYEWRFNASGDGVKVSGFMKAPKDHFAKLPYRNPPGGVKTCLNTKIARCEVTVERAGMPTRTLVSACRAGFEILGDPAILAARNF